MIYLYLLPHLHAWLTHVCHLGYMWHPIKLSIRNWHIVAEADAKAEAEAEAEAELQFRIADARACNKGGATASEAAAGMHD